MIRVNAIHPTNCNTHLLHNDGLYNLFRPDLAMPTPYVEPEDIAALALFLASDESRYITGQQIRVDGGSLLKAPGLG
jgi:NAD(P)-dependent dehydrogenase (short-subunit alcohol dehydrogenase family)